MSIVVRSGSILSHLTNQSISTLVGIDSGFPCHSQVFSHDLYLHVKTWPVPRHVEFQGKVLFLHSIGDNKDTYAHIWPQLQDEGYEVISYDARGFGATSPGKLAGLSNERCTYQDLDRMIESTTENYTGPLFLAGISMGGAIVLNYMVKGKYNARINGYLSIAPLILLHPKTDQGVFVKVALPYLTKYMPRYTASGKVKEKYMTSDPDRVKIIKNNPRAMKVSAPLAKGMLDRGKKLLEPEYINQSIDMPLVVFHGTADFVNSYQATEDYFSMVKAVTDKKMFSYNNYFHDLLQETPERIEKVLEDIKFWLADHTPQPETRVNSIETAPKGFF